MTKSLTEYIQEAKKDATFEFIKDIKKKEILYLFFGYSLLYFDEILNNNSDENLIEIKSHTILIYLGSLIEALTYYFVDKKLDNKIIRRKYFGYEALEKIQKIKTEEELYICKPIIKEITFDDTIQFFPLINGVKDNHFLSSDIIEKINYCRRKRNLIHINVLMLNEYALFDELDKIFTYTKEIIDEIKKKLK